MRDLLQDFLKQDLSETSDFDRTKTVLKALVGGA